VSNSSRPRGWETRKQPIGTVQRAAGASRTFTRQLEVAAAQREDLIATFLLLSRHRRDVEPFSQEIPSLPAERRAGTCHRRR
jgi:hypothetical protein